MRSERDGGPMRCIVLTVILTGGKRFDDLTGTIFMGHHQPLSVWLTFLYLMGLNVSNQQIAEELGLDPSDGQAMAELLRGGILHGMGGVGD